MKRPIFIVTIGFINGIIIGIYLNKSISFFCVLLCILMLTKILNKKKRKKRQWINTLIIFLASLIMSGIIVNIKNNEYTNKYKEYDSQEVEIVGTIISKISQRDYNFLCKIKIETVNNKSNFKGDNLLLYIKKDNTSSKKNLKFGDKISFIAIYNEPDVARNYKGFDYKNYLKTKKIYGILNNKYSNKIKVLSQNNTNTFDKLIFYLSEKIESSINELLSKDNANLLKGILLGQTEDIDKNIKEDFSNSNLSHMLAVSGMHVGYIIVAIKIFFNKKTIGKNKQSIVTIFIIFLFINLANSTPSVMRAGISIILYTFSTLIHRKPDLINIICVDCLLTLVINPFSLFNTGMQLSYAGTLGIIMFYKIIYEKLKVEEKIKNKILKYIIQSMIISLSANIFIMPITLYSYHTISLTFIISNIVSSPILGIILFLGLIIVLISFVSMSVAKPIAMVLDLLISIFIKIVNVLSKIPGAKIYFISFSILGTVLIFVLIIYLFLKIKKTTKILNKLNKLVCLILMIIILFDYFCFLIPSGKLKIHFIDVGQGDACLIITPSNKKILIDRRRNHVKKL